MPKVQYSHIHSFRKAQSSRRLAVLGTPGVSLDSSFTGAGKSYCDAGALPLTGGSVTVVPTHRNSEEVKAEYERQGVRALLFPVLDESTCRLYSDAAKLIAMNLRPQKVLCPTCEYAPKCPYRKQVAQAMAARHVIVTHKRYALQAEELTKGRSYVTAHEAIYDTLCPQSEATDGWLVVKELAHLAVIDTEEPEYYLQMEEIAQHLYECWRNLKVTQCLALPIPRVEPPEDEEVHLGDTALAHGITANGATLKLIRDLLAGKIDVLMFHVGARIGGKLRKSIVGQGRSQIPRHPATLFSDATVDKDDLQRMLDQSVRDITTGHNLPRHFPVVQIPKDITIQMVEHPERGLSLLRGLLHDIPEKKVGIITHRAWLRVLGTLGRHYSPRLVMRHYFHDGATRGSNEWLEACDALIVFGTPRPGGEAVRKHLIRLSKKEAYLMDNVQANWRPYIWQGVLENGEPLPVTTLGYGNADWQKAYESLVLAELKQCIGRARCMLEEGIPCYVVTPEPLGEALRLVQPLNEEGSLVLHALHKQPLSTQALQEHTGISHGAMRRLLCDLQSAGRVRKVIPHRWMLA